MSLVHQTLRLLTIWDADRYEKRHKNMAVHVSPAFRVELGDVVTVGEYLVSYVTWGLCD